MSDIRQLRLARWERIKHGGIWRFVLLRGVLGWGLSLGIIGIILEQVSRKEEALAWYLILGLCLVGGFAWGLAMWFVTMRIYSRWESRQGQPSLTFALDLMKPRALYVIVGVFVALLVGGAALIAWGYCQVYGVGGWRDQLYASEGAVASRQALDDFRVGHLRLYTLGGENEKPKYAGTNDGPFEIWIPQFYPSLGHAHRYSREQFVEFYNRKMKYMHEHPDEFMPKGQEVRQDATANRGQSSGSETNRTPGLAGPGR